MRKILILAGPTAVGKTKFSIEIAKALNGEIVSCDSMQLYKYMDIGSAKPSTNELSEVPHHLIGVIDPREDFSVAQYQKLAKASIHKILSKDKLPIISGGTGLYLNSLIYEMDFSKTFSDNSYRNELYKLLEEQGSQALYDLLKGKNELAAKEIHPNNSKRIIRALERIESGETSYKPFQLVKKKCEEYNPIFIVLNRDREELYNRINKRVDIIVKEGLLDEVKSLMNMGLTEDMISMKGIGYKEVIDYFNGVYNLETAIDKVKQNTRHYAKKQLTWYRRYDTIKWINISDFKDDNVATREILKWLKERI